METQEGPGKQLELQAIALAKGIEVLGLSIRPYNALKRSGIERVFDLATKNADEIGRIRNLGSKSLSEIHSKLQRYLEANSIPVSEFLPQLGELENSIVESYAQVESALPTSTESSRPIVEEARDVILSTSDLLELTLLQAVQHPLMSLERWGDLVAENKFQGLVELGIPGGISVYGKSSISLDPSFDRYLSSRTRNALERSGIYDVQSASMIRIRELAGIKQFGRNSTIELLRLIKSASQNFGNSNPTKEINEAQSSRISLELRVNELSPERQRSIKLLRVWAELKKRLTDEVRAGRLSPNVRLKGLRVAEWLREDVERLDDGYVQTVCSDIESQLAYLTIDDELRDLLDQLGSRQTAILIARFGQIHQTLQNEADRLGLTRERIRQVETKAKYNLAISLASDSFWRLRTSLSIAEEMGEEISLPKLEATLKERDLMAQKPLFIEKSVGLVLNSLDVFLVLLRANEDAGSTIDAFRIPNNLRSIFDHPGLTANEIEVSKALPKKALREIRRECHNTGAVSAILWGRKLKVAVATISKALSAHGYVQLDNEWLTLKRRPGIPISSYYSAFQVNVLKMLAICGPLSVEDVRRGLQNHVSRFGFAIPPSFVLRKLLPMYGFKIDNDDRIAIGKAKGIKLTPNSGEKIILDLIKDQGPVATFQELSEAFSRRKRSQALLTTTLRHSVLFLRVDTGLYVLRGTRIAREEIEAAVARRPAVEQNGRLQFSSNGIITWEINIGSYGLGGTIPSGEAAKLFGEWKISTGKAEVRRLMVGEQQIWGLAKTFQELHIKIGDRVALRFNPERRLVQVVKLEPSANEENSTQ